MIPCKKCKKNFNRAQFMQPSFCDHSITAYLKGFNEIKVRIGVLVQDNGIASGKWNAAPAFVDAGMIKFGELAALLCSASLPACRRIDIGDTWTWTWHGAKGQ